MTVKERLKVSIDSKKLSVRAFELRCSLSNGLVNNITESISKSSIDKISKEFADLNIGWLLTGEGLMLKSEAVEPVADFQLPANETIELQRKIIELLEKETKRLTEVVKHFEDKFGKV